MIALCHYEQSPTCLLDCDFDYTNSFFVRKFVEFTPIRRKADPCKTTAGGKFHQLPKRLLIDTVIGGEGYRNNRNRAAQLFPVVCVHWSPLLWVYSRFGVAIFLF